MTGITSKTDTTPIPPIWRDRLNEQLESGERLVAFFEPDLNGQLEFADGLIVLTDRRLLLSTAMSGSARNEATDVSAKPVQWRSWLVNRVTTLRTREAAGLGVMELVGPNALEASWQYTMAKSVSALPFVHAFQELSTAGARSESQTGRLWVATICPSCGAKLEPPQTVCEACFPAAAPPPVRSLWRLGRFARPRAAMIGLGFGLTLASTAAGLVRPYITILLLNNVLIPRQSGLPVDFGVVPWYLAALFGSAALAWLLSWAKTYVLSRVSEQISADLRNETYAHLQRLSLEFFGGKRTGDLISRVGSDTDRICTFSR